MFTHAYPTYYPKLQLLLFIINNSRVSIGYKNCEWKPHIRSVSAKICSCDITIKHLYYFMNKYESLFNPVVTYTQKTAVQNAVCQGRIISRARIYLFLHANTRYCRIFQKAFPISKQIKIVHTQVKILTIKNSKTQPFFPQRRSTLHRYRYTDKYSIVLKLRWKYVKSGKKLMKSKTQPQLAVVKFRNILLKS